MTILLFVILWLLLGWIAVRIDIAMFSNPEWYNLKLAIIGTLFGPFALFIVLIGLIQRHQEDILKFVFGGKKKW